MNRMMVRVMAGLSVGGLVTLAFPFVVAAAEPEAPAAAPPTVAPPPPPMVDEKTADKAEADAAKAKNDAKTKPPEQGNQNQGDPDLEPQVTLIETPDETREEVRVNGVLRYIKVKPKAGTVYYLLPVNGATGMFVRRDSLDSGLRVPMWEILSW
ncbi:MAG: DUF2782 domain-containing protein [Betaproteobacteria bacterium]|nr:DUF2782 domain-containing protein [Betaproteobacteria bacterium]